MVVRARLLKSQTVERTGFLMISKQKMKVVYGLMVYFLVVGVLCYAAFPVSPPEEPMRIMFKVTAGKVLFDHYSHTSESAYGLSCWDCHHNPLGDDEVFDEKAALAPCGECHAADEDATQPVEIEDTQIMNRTDAFHAQCINCHQEFEAAGPIECETCHIMQ